MSPISNAAITNVMEPALPGTAAVVMVGGGLRNTRLYAFRLPEGPSTSPGQGKLTTSKPRALKVLQRTDEAFTVQMPDGAVGLGVSARTGVRSGAGLDREPPAPRLALAV